MGRFKPIKQEVLIKKNKKEGSKIVGDIINVKVANPDMKKDDSFDSSLIGKIKISIKPVLK